MPSAASDDYMQIMNLIATYPELIDGGDFAGIGRLFADAPIEFEGGEVLEGAAAIQRNYEQNVRVYPDDGTPHTRHTITNPIVEIDESGESATCRYYITVFQRTDAFPLQPIWANRYEDRLRKVDGTWRFAGRRGFAHLPGNISEHLLQAHPY